MLPKSPDLALFLTQPTVRTLRFLSCRLNRSGVLHFLTHHSLPPLLRQAL
jgi:hypothetical protein